MLLCLPSSGWPLQPTWWRSHFPCGSPGCSRGLAGGWVGPSFPALPPPTASPLPVIQSHSVRSFPAPREDPSPHCGDPSPAQTLSIQAPWPPRSRCSQRPSQGRGFLRGPLSVTWASNLEIINLALCAQLLLGWNRSPSCLSLLGGYGNTLPITAVCNHSYSSTPEEEPGSHPTPHGAWLTSHL